MKNKLSIFAIVFLFVVSSCEKQVIEKDSHDATVSFNAQDESSNLKGQNVVANSNSNKVLNFRAHLSGGQEVPPNDSKATGQALFQLSKDGQELSYKLIVANIENVTQAHIHLAPAGQNGGVITWLYPSGPPSQLLPGKSNGVLYQGVISSSNLVGAMAGMELEDLVEAIIAGNTYVNVHTIQFPPGEIRGQIR